MEIDNKNKIYAVVIALIFAAIIPIQLTAIEDNSSVDDEGDEAVWSDVQTFNFQSEDYITQGSNDNVIYHNNFINNTYDAYDSAGNNRWNASYPEGGNYWSNYTSQNPGVYDYFSGPYPQIIPGTDQIWDGAYTIWGTSGALDYYPLGGEWPPQLVVYVDDDAPAPWYNNPNHYETISDAFASVFTGGTIYVWNGTYNEHVWGNKSMNLIGNGSECTTIHGIYATHVINITCDYVNISGFTIENSGGHQYDAGVYIITNNSVITDNRITDCQVGVYLTSNNTITQNNTILNNNISGNALNMYLKDTKENYIMGNQIEHSTVNYAIYLNNASNNTFYNNNCSYNEKGVYIESGNYNEFNLNILDNISVGDGFHVKDDENYIYNCSILNAGTNAIYLDGCGGCKVYQTNVSGSPYGMRIVNSGENTIEKVKAYDCTSYGIYISGDSEDNILFHNNLINNVVNGWDDSTLNNTWYNETIKEGNYWSNYHNVSQGAYDNNSNGIADDPYDIPGFAGANDSYALMWGTSQTGFISINGKGNRCLIHESCPTFNWTKKYRTHQYWLQIAIDQNFTNVVINITNISNWPNWFFASYLDQNETRVSFELPPVFALPCYGVYYCRVSPYQQQVVP